MFKFPDEEVSIGMPVNEIVKIVNENSRLVLEVEGEKKPSELFAELIETDASTG